MGINGLDLTGGQVFPAGGSGAPEGGRPGGLEGGQASPGNGQAGGGMPGAGPLSADLEELEQLEALGRAMAGQRFLEAVAQKNSEALLSMGTGQEEAAGAEKAQEDPAYRSTDEASLSPDSRAAVMEEEAAVHLKRQLEESLSRKLQQLEKWEPSGYKQLEGELAQLRELYRSLVSEILKLPQDMQELQAQKQKLVLAEALQKLGAGKYPNLNGLFLEAGELRSANLLLASAFRLVTGQAVPPEAFDVLAGPAGRESLAYGRGQDGGPLSPGLPEPARTGRSSAAAPAGEIFPDGSGRAAGLPASGARGQEGAGAYASSGRARSAGSRPEASAADEGPETGVLYHKSGQKGISADAGYQEQVRLSERFSLHPAGEPILSETSGRRVKGKWFTAAEMERAESFCRYFRQGGNLMEHPGLTARNEELLGFLMAQNMMKGEIFSEYGGVGREMGRNIRDILEKLSRYYLGRAEQECGREEGGAAYSRLDRKAVQRIYYQVMQLFHRMKKPQKALEEGLKRAVEEFCMKQEKTENKKKKRYQEGAGFFEKTLSGKSRKRQWEEAGRELEKDWGDFLKSLGQQGNEFLQLAFSRYSPWGAQLEPEAGRHAAGKLHPAIPVLVTAAVLLFLLLFVMR